MRIKPILGVALGLSALPCLAGYLEDGIRSHERGDSFASVAGVAGPTIGEGART